ncbi:MAG: DUF4430 domain-containing protein [Candidatus Pacebacteria bacterium]|nr:DUF4430 domain-containing protein [Candidatus Paceibacterota bacterium]
MKNKISIFIVLASFVIFGFFNTVHAAGLNITTSVDVPSSCSVTDTNGVVHNYPQAGFTNSYLAICALEAAENNGAISNPQFSNDPQYGLFITAINNVAADPSSQYWAIYQNGTSANFGATELPISAGDTIMFQLDDFNNNSLGDQVTININSLIPPAPVGSGGGQLNDNTPSNTSTTTPAAPSTVATIASIPTPIVTTTPTFDTGKAFDFLTAQQGTDGSFDGDLYTDWAAIALASGNYESQTIKLTKYLDGETMENPILTDYERRAMALMALGLNPYDTNGENYIGKIVTSFDGKQFGDPNEDNDDIFALIVLQNAGYTQSDPIISSDINFILSKQGSDGSWDSDSVDMTGAAMEALSAFNQVGQVKDALANAENFLEQSERADGSWNDNASSTAWAIEGILAQNEKPADWLTKPTDGTAPKTPLDYLATIQDIDGGVKDADLQTKIWETAYVNSALSGKTWNQAMQTFEKQNVAMNITSVGETTPPIINGENTNTVSVIKNIPKKEVATIVKSENPAVQNIASAINATVFPVTITQIEPIHKNWFMSLLRRIF